MTQPPYAAPRDEENPGTTDYNWPPASDTTDVPAVDPYYTEPAYAEASYVEPVNGASAAETYAPESDSQTSSTTDVAKDQAGAVKDTAVEQGQHVAEVAKEQVANVAGEAGEHVKDLLAEGISELRSQAGSQQKRLATGIHSLAGELGGMASKSEKSGPLTDYAHQAAAQGGELAHWLENAEPSDVLDTLRSFARRRPVVFLAASAAAGIVVGRLTRGLVANRKDEAETAALTTAPVTPSYSASPQYAVEPARENISLQEVPTSGTGAGYTTDAPDYVADDATLPYGTTPGYNNTGYNTPGYNNTGYDGAAR